MYVHTKDGYAGGITNRFGRKNNKNLQNIQLFLTFLSKLIEKCKKRLTCVNI